MRQDSCIPTFEVKFITYINYFSHGLRITEKDECKKGAGYLIYSYLKKEHDFPKIKTARLWISVVMPSIHS